MTSAPNFEMYSGDTKTLVFTVTETDNTTPVDITGATIRFWVAREPDVAYNSTLVKFLKQTPTDISIPVGTDGKFEVNIESIDTNTLTGIYRYWAHVTYTDGAVETVAEGYINIK